MNKTQQLYLQAKKIIPGGTQLLSKRPEMFAPGIWPPYYTYAKGTQITDLDGKKYTDMSYMGIGACILGYADKDINDTVIKVIKSGNMTTLNSPEEVNLAKKLLRLHPWADMVRLARSGGESMSIAIRIARAATSKDIILFCGYHGWHDWYLSANLSSDKALDGHLLPGLEPAGVPRSLRGTAIPFHYNNPEELEKLIHGHKGRVAAIVLESIRSDFPTKDFILAIQKGARKSNAAIIVDEITAGWRLNPGGAHLLFNLEPDIAVFAKGMSNGFPMGAIIGKKKFMSAAQKTFISSTYWTERIGPAAALATIEKFIDKKVHKHLIATGKEVKNIWHRCARKHNLQIKISGIDPLGHFTFICSKPLEAKTLFTQEMLKKGFLATNAFYASYAHKKSELLSYNDATDESFAIISKAIRGGQLEKYLKCPASHSGFKRLT